MYISFFFLYLFIGLFIFSLVVKNILIKGMHFYFGILKWQLCEIKANLYLAETRDTASEGLSKLSFYHFKREKERERKKEEKREKERERERERERKRETIKERWCVRGCACACVGVKEG